MFRKNQKVFAQGDPADAVFYIREGKVKVCVTSEQGTSRYTDRVTFSARAA